MVRRTQRPDVGKVCPRQGERIGRGACGQQKPVVREIAAVGQFQSAPLPVDPNDRATEHQVHLLLRIPGAGVESALLARLLPQENRLGQRRSVIRQMWFRTDQADAAGPAVLAQRGRGLGAAVACTDDGDRGLESTHLSFLGAAVLDYCPALTAAAATMASPIRCSSFAFNASPALWISRTSLFWLSLALPTQRVTSISIPTMALSIMSM